MKRLSACVLALALVIPTSATLWLEAAAAAPPKATTAGKNAAKAAPDAPARSTTGIETEAHPAHIVDFPTRARLLGKKADQRIPPASMSKMMAYYTGLSYL